MSRIAVELVPRDRDTIISEARNVREFFPVADSINIPDLMRLELRSWDAAQALSQSGLYSDVIPHIRAIDIAPEGPLPGSDVAGLKEILVVQGDLPADLSRHSYPNSTESIIRRYKREMPHLKVYAAFDPYRRAPYAEREAVLRKVDSGADGFFTQPLFDLRMLGVCMEWLHQFNVFWGFSPVIGPKSRSYWETTNKVLFPHDFEPTLEANIDFARAAMKLVRQEGGNVYLMPLRVKLERYLPPLLDT